MKAISTLFKEKNRNATAHGIYINIKWYATYSKRVPESIEVAKWNVPIVPVSSPQHFGKLALCIYLFFKFLTVRSKIQYSYYFQSLLVVLNKKGWYSFSMLASFRGLTILYIWIYENLNREI